MLELEVVNHSQTEIVIELLGPGGADAGFREVVEPDDTRGLSMERPGPEWLGSRGRRHDRHGLRGMAA